MKDRIRQIMEAQHMNQQTFASYTGIGTASLSSIFTGRTRPTLNHVEAIMKSFPNVNVKWLLDGTGGMLSTGEIDNVENTSQNNNGGNQGAQKKDDKVAVEPSLFDVPTTHNGYQTARNDAQKGAQPYSEASINGAKQPSPTIQQVVVEKSVARKITEIRIFYDDQTWESFVPKK